MSEFCNIYKHSSCYEERREAWIDALKLAHKKSLELMDITYFQMWLVRELEELKNEQQI